MTTSQITNSLTELGISNPMNKWVKLPRNISMIRLAQDTNIYIDHNTELYYFDTANELLYSSFGDFSKYDSIETASTAHSQDRIYSFNMIAGFICSTYAGPQGSYYTKNFTR